MPLELLREAHGEAFGVVAVAVQEDESGGTAGGGVLGGEDVGGFGVGHCQWGCVVWCGVVCWGDVR